MSTYEPFISIFLSKSFSISKLITGHFGKKKTGLFSVSSEEVTTKNSKKSTLMLCDRELYKIPILAIVFLSFLSACSGNKAKNKLPPVQNSYLAKASQQSPVANFIIRPALLYLTGTIAADSGVGHPIYKVEYGSMANLGTIYDTTMIDDTKFTLALDDDKLDNSKNNIIKLSTGKLTETVSSNYYYSHIKGKPFTQFLPGINNLEILALEATLGENIFLTSTDQNSYPKLKSLVIMGKGYTFKGLALTSFSSKTDVSNFTSEEKLYPGSFELTFNNLLPDIPSAEAQYFSMKITLEQETLTTTEANQASNLASKPAIKTIEVKNFRFANFSTIISYSSNGSAVPWASNIDNAKSNMLAISQKDSKITQVAGNITMYSNISTSTTSILQYARIVFASNETCKIGSGGCKAVALSE